MTDIHTLSGAYALDAVNDIERAQFVRHLDACPACEQEVAELTETASRLAGAVAAAPPARLRGRVLAEIGRTRQLGPRRAPSAAVPGGWRRRVAVAVAAAVVLLGAGAGAVVEEQRVRDARQQSTQAERIEAVLAAPDAVVHTATGPGGTGRVTLVVSRSRDEAVAVLGGLPSPGVDRAYQLWLVDGAQAATPTGLLGPGMAGGTVLVEGLRGQQDFAVTNEPEHGSAQPTTALFGAIPLA